jgi:integrase
MRTLFAVGIYTGLRLGDAVRLDWGSVDLVRCMVSLVPRKTAKSGKLVVIPIHPALLSIFLETPAKSRRGHVMPDLAASYESDNSIISGRIQSVFKKCGITTSSKASEDSRAAVDVGFHSLRHTFVSLSANAGAPLAVVQAIVGHSNPAMTRHYYHESDAALISAVSALPDVTGVLSLIEAPDATRATLDDITTKLEGLTVNQLAELERAVKKERKRRTPK